MIVGLANWIIDDILRFQSGIIPDSVKINSSYSLHGNVLVSRLDDYPKHKGNIFLNLF